MTRTDLETLKNSVEGFLSDWNECAEEEQLQLLKEMKPGEVDYLTEHWEIFAHTYQFPPMLAPDGHPWHTWLLIGGRGAGKTRAGAEWVRAQALGLPPFATEKASHIALVGETEHDVREVMIEGVSGLLAVHGWHERRPGSPRASGWNGATDRSRRCFPRRTRKACAVRNSAAPGRTRWRNGATRKLRSTCCNSACGWAPSPGN